MPAAKFFSVLLSLFVSVSALALESDESNVFRIENELIEEAFQRGQWMVRASHILVAVKPNASPAEHIAALEKISLIRQSIVTGRPFEIAAITVSDDPTVNESHGDLGYFTVFEQLYPIETAAYETPVGKISQPVKTRFGYHLVATTDRYSIKLKKRVSHLLIEDPTMAGKQRITAISKLAPDKKFETLVRLYSDDLVTRETGGDLGFERLVNELEKVRLSLGLHEVSSPVKSDKGWHLLKVTEIAEEQHLSDVYSSLQTRIHLDNRVERVLSSALNKETFYPIVRTMQQF